MCGRRLGLITGEVYDYQLESSSNKDSEHLATYGRLFFPETGWCARYDDTKPWFLVSFLNYFICIYFFKYDAFIYTQRDQTVSCINDNGRYK